MLKRKVDVQLKTNKITFFIVYYRKAPTNSFLSPIRSEKAPPRRSSASSPVSLRSLSAARPALLMSSPLSTQQITKNKANPIIPSQPEPSQQVQKSKRPYPLIHASSSPASIFPLKMNRRRRKVSFSEHVVVVRTIIQTDEDDNIEEEENDDHESCIYDVFRRHSTGSTPTTSSDDIENNEVAKQQILSVSKSLQRFAF